MLEALCGNQSIVRILIFLLVNGKCYGTQLHKTLKVPLTPLQKALNRLEEGSIISSWSEGKTRFYRFNRAYPLLSELEALLTKAYSLLKPEERRSYFCTKELQTLHSSGAQTLAAFWTKLTEVSQLQFEACSKKESGWNGKGAGQVVVTKNSPNTLLFTEKGAWRNRNNQEISFNNVFRWTFDSAQGVILLEHLRHGQERPVELFKLQPTGTQTIASVDAHLCEGDLYFGQMHFDKYSLRLNWRIIGPKKNEEIDYLYT